MTTKPLETLLAGLPHQLLAGTVDGTEVQHITADSRKVADGTLFVALVGTQTDGHQYLSQAVAQGASVLVVSKGRSTEATAAAQGVEVVIIEAENTAKLLGHLASAFYNHPSKKLKLVATTGTNGKTTSVTLQHSLFKALGYKTGLLSTVENKIDEKVVPATHTTPDPVSLQAMLADMVEAGCTHCFMEASSHAIVQERIAGLHLAGAIFSNITHDHLDYHKTFDDYIKAKKKLFDDLPKTAFALTNADDKRGMVMLQNTQAKRYTYALKSVADYEAKLA